MASRRILVELYSNETTTPSFYLDVFGWVRDRESLESVGRWTELPVRTHSTESPTRRGLKSLVDTTDAEIDSLGGLAPQPKDSEPTEDDFDRMTDAEYVQWMRDHQPKDPGQ